MARKEKNSVGERAHRNAAHAPPALPPAAALRGQGAYCTTPLALCQPLQRKASCLGPPPAPASSPPPAPASYAAEAHCRPGRRSGRGLLRRLRLLRQVHRLPPVLSQHGPPAQRHLQQGGGAGGGAANLGGGARQLLLLCGCVFRAQKGDFAWRGVCLQAHAPTSRRRFHPPRCSKQGTHVQLARERPPPGGASSDGTNRLWDWCICMIWQIPSASNGMYCRHWLVPSGHLLAPHPSRSCNGRAWVGMKPMCGMRCTSIPPPHPCLLPVCRQPHPQPQPPHALLPSCSPPPPARPIKPLTLLLSHESTITSTSCPTCIITHHAASHGRAKTAQHSTAQHT